MRWFTLESTRERVGGMELETQLQKVLQAVLLSNGATQVKEFGINAGLLDRSNKRRAYIWSHTKGEVFSGQVYKVFDYKLKSSAEIILDTRSHVSCFIYSSIPLFLHLKGKDAGSFCSIPCFQSPVSLAVPKYSVKVLFCSCQPRETKKC